MAGRWPSFSLARETIWRQAGSDFPVIKPDRWLADFDKLEIKETVKPKILKDNAVRLLGLDG